MPIHRAAKFQAPQVRLRSGTGSRSSLVSCASPEMAMSVVAVMDSGVLGTFCGCVRSAGMSSSSAGLKAILVCGFVDRPRHLQGRSCEPRDSSDLRNLQDNCQ